MLPQTEHTGSQPQIASYKPEAMAGAPMQSMQQVLPTSAMVHQAGAPTSVVRAGPGFAAYPQTQGVAYPQGVAVVPAPTVSSACLANAPPNTGTAVMPGYAPAVPPTAYAPC